MKKKCKYVKREGDSCSLNNNCAYPDCPECEHPFKRLHWIGTKVYCNKCGTSLVKEHTEYVTLEKFKKIINSITLEVIENAKRTQHTFKSNKFGESLWYWIKESL